MGAAAPSSELFQVGTRDEAALPIPFHCPPAILPLQDDFQDVSSGDIQLVRILGKRTKVRWAGRAALGALGLGSGWHPPPQAVNASLSPGWAESSELHVASWSHRTKLLSGPGWPLETESGWGICGTQPLTPLVCHCRRPSPWGFSPLAPCCAHPPALLQTQGQVCSLCCTHFQAHRMQPSRCW